MNANTLLRIYTKPDIRIDADGRQTMHFRAACKQPMSSGTKRLDVCISDPLLIERANKLNLDKGDLILAWGSLRLNTHRDGSPNLVLSCTNFELIPKRRTESPTVEAASQPRSANKNPAEALDHDLFADSPMAYVEHESEPSDMVDIFADM